MGDPILGSDLRLGEIGVDKLDCVQGYGFIGGFVDEAEATIMVEGQTNTRAVAAAMFP